MRMPLPRVAVRAPITLLESSRVSTVSHQLVHGGSVVAQVVVVCAVVVVMSRATDESLAVTNDRPTFLAPLMQERPRPVQEALTFTALGGASAPEALPTVGETRRATLTPDLAPVQKIGGGDDRAASEAKVIDTTRAFSDIEVDSAATRDPDSEGPVYPPALMAKGIQGSVLATFVVNADGRADVGTYLPLEATDTLFAKAVRDALPRMKFRPASLNGVPVRQQVELRFSFRVTKPIGPAKPPVLVSQRNRYRPRFTLLQAGH